MGSRNMIRRHLAVIAVGSLLISLTAQAEDWKAQEFTTAVDNQIPATLWGAGYVGGAPSVLVLWGNDAIGYGYFNRRVPEFARALGSKVEYVSLADATTASPVTDNQRALELLQSRRWDVIVSWVEHEGHQKPSGYEVASDEVKFQVLQQVKAGAGLVFFGSGMTAPNRPPEVCRADRVVIPAPDIFAGLNLTGRAARRTAQYVKEFKAVPDEKSFRESYAQFYRFGNGRIVTMNHPDVSLGYESPSNSSRVARKASWAERIDPDYYQAELIRAVWHAAGKDPKMTFVETPPPVWELALGGTQGQTSRAVLAVAGEPRDLTITWRLRDLQGRVWYSARLAPKAVNDRIEYPVTLPDLDAGWYQLDVWVDSPAGRENFGYSAVHVTEPVRVAVERSQEGIPVGQSVRGTAKIEAADPAQPAPAPLAVRLRLLDNLDRVLEEKCVPCTLNTPVSFEFALTEVHALQARVLAEAMIGQRVAARESTTFNQLKHYENRFNVVMWGVPDGIYSAYARRRFWNTGVTACLNFGSWAEEANLTSLPFFIGGWGWEGKVNGKSFKGLWGAVRPDPVTGISTEALHPDLITACLNDPGKGGQVLDAQQHYWEVGRSHPIFTYNLYDEGPHKIMCLDPHCLAAYRTWLKEQYHNDLAALNTEWASNYRSWDEVTVLDNDWEEIKALKAGNFARWSDRTRFADVNFSRSVLGQLTARARKTDPSARVGFEGSGGFGMDLDELIANSGFWCPYDSLATDLLASLRPKGYTTAFWIGYEKEAQPLITKAWRMVFCGADSVWWWMLQGKGGFHGWFAPNDEPYPATQQLIDQCILPLRQGLGDLLLNLDRQNDGIAVYYSVAAANAQSLPAADKFSEITSATSGFIKLIEDSGYQWITVTRQRLLAGELEKRGVKMVILPYTQALGEDEVAALRRFAAAGGLVLADLRPGVLSGHCRPLGHGPADGLFGLRRTGSGNPLRVAGEATMELRGQTVPLVVDGGLADGHVTADVARAAATWNGAPVGLVNPVERGQAVLLNFSVAAYSEQRGTPAGLQQVRFFQALAGAAGVQPRLTRVGSWMRTRTVTWARGGVTLHGFYKDGGEPGEVQALLPRGAHAFNLRQGAKLKGSNARMAMRPASADFLAFYPYDPGQPTVKASLSQFAGGERVTFRIAMSRVPAGETGVFSYHTRLLDPQGRWVDVIPWSVQGPGGKAEVTVRFALDDAPGRWALEVREITTGRKGVAHVVKQ